GGVVRRDALVAEELEWKARQVKRIAGAVRDRADAGERETMCIRNSLCGHGFHIRRTEGRVRGRHDIHVADQRASQPRPGGLREVTGIATRTAGGVAGLATENVTSAGDAGKSHDLCG